MDVCFKNSWCLIDLFVYGLDVNIIGGNFDNR